MLTYYAFLFDPFPKGSQKSLATVKMRLFSIQWFHPLGLGQKIIEYLKQLTYWYLMKNQAGWFIKKWIIKKKHPYHDESMWKGAPPQNFSNAKYLRENMTNAELIFWNRVKNKQFNGLKFRRQHPIHKYIADFYCHKLKLIIEVDGDYHNTSEQKDYDILRTNDFNSLNIEVLRFKNSEVENDIEGVLKTIEKYV